MADPSREITVTVCNRLGLHTRPAKTFVQTAAAYGAEIRVEKEGFEVNGKSIMGLMSLLAPKGTQLRIRAEGADAEEALEALRRLVEAGFGEEVD